MDGVIQQSYRDGFLTVTDGIRLHYRDYPGSGGRAPILCLPGLTRNSRDFAQFADAFSPRFRVIALDFRGRGESDHDPVPARYNPLTYAGDVQQLLDRTGHRPGDLRRDFARRAGDDDPGDHGAAAASPPRSSTMSVPSSPSKGSTASNPMSARICASKAGTTRRPRLPPTTASVRPATRKRTG